MGRIQCLSIEGYRSIGEYVEVRFPRDAPLVLLGENSTGKSNIVRAIDLLFGEGWPRSHYPDDHEFFGRNPLSGPIAITADVTGVSTDRYGPIDRFSWTYHPGSDDPSFIMESDSGDSPWANGEARDQCFCMLIGADRRLSYQLSYASRWTFLSRLMRRFHKQLMADDALAQRLKELFDQIVATFYELGPFTAFSQGLRQRAEQFGTSLRYGLTVDFSAYDPSNFFHSLRVYPQTDGMARSFDELGTGQEQVLAIAFACAYAEALGNNEDSGLLLVIEEPEAHLHPLAQRWLGRMIHELVASEIQVVITTHSPAFVDLINLDGIAVVRKSEEGGSTTVSQQTMADLAGYCQGTGAPRASTENIGPYYTASATEETLSGLFARSCLLVEGPTDAFGFPALLKQVGLDLLALGIQVVSVGGIGNLARWWRLYTSFGLPVFVVFDADSRDDPNGVRRNELLTALRATEEDYGVLVTQEGLGVSKTFAVCIQDYESAMRTLFPSQYDTLEEEARAIVGSGKPLIARYAAERLDRSLDDGGWRVITQLATAIQGI
jgi:putative ATP-dependent endonuclease of OLD family